jgi:hypothetical protein
MVPNIMVTAMKVILALILTKLQANTFTLFYFYQVGNGISSKIRSPGSERMTSQTHTSVKWQR